MAGQKPYLFVWDGAEQFFFPGGEETGEDVVAGLPELRTFKKREQERVMEVGHDQVN